MSAAREAVAAICVEGDDIPYRYYGKADEILAALRPIIAAEIRAWAVSTSRGWRSVYADADAIADRITTTGEQQQ